MREHRKLLQMIVGLLEVEQTAEDCLASAAIEQIARVDCRFCAADRFDLDLHPVAAEIERRHFGFLTNFRAILA